MFPQSPRTSGTPLNLKAAAFVALAFGAATVISGGNVIFGPDTAREMAGAYVPFVVWFNFCAGFLYIAAGVGIRFGRSWALALSLAIAAATALVAAAFALRAMQGQAFEMRTVGALALRIGVWAAIAAALIRARRR